MTERKTLNRRGFLKASASTAAFSVVPRSVLGGSRFIAPSDQLQVGYVGAGTQGQRLLMEALPKEELRIAAICDPNRDSTDYIPWSQHELRNKVRKFLNDPAWGETDAGCRGGREVGREIVQSYYAQQGRPKDCTTYSDFREMLAKEKDLDAVYIMAPDHLHATIALASMKQGKHVITHKPVSNIYHETRLTIEAAVTAGVATHMYCSADLDSTPQLCEWIWSGAIGDVREVHNWSSRPFWPQGMSAYPSEKVSVPEGFDWDLWLGPVPDRPYHPAFTHAVFRGWYEFGAGALGDMGHYSFRQIFEILKLGSPSSVEASRSQEWAIVDHLWKKQENTVSYPRASSIHWEFPAREKQPEVSLFWYDGGMRPPLPKELEADGEQMPREGLLFVGDRGKILAGFNGMRPKLIPKKKQRAFSEPPQSLPRPQSELDQWIAACQGGPASRANFQTIEPVCETICLGNVALRISEKLKWNSVQKGFENSPDANKLLKRNYRPGWEL